MKRFLLWQYMINKRLLHKKIFVLLLCLVPLLVWGMCGISQEDSGIMTILLSVEDTQDTLARQIVEDVLADDSILHYEVVEPAQAYELVAAGKADCAWILREDFQEKLASTLAKRGESTAPVYVVVQEDTVALQLARTKMYAFVYPYLAKLISRQYLENQDIAEKESLERELEHCYEAGMVEDNLFRVVYEEAKDSALGEETETERQSYLMLPVRGLLMIFLPVSGLVVTLYYLQDGERGMFAWIPVKKRRGLLYCYLFAAGLDVGVAVVLSLLISEGKMLSLRELLLLLLYLFTMAVFCQLMKLLCRKAGLLAKWIPLVSLAMLGLCPVFLDLGSGFMAQYLFPPTYYLRALYSDKMVLAMVAYTLVLFGIESVGWRIAQNRVG